MIKLKRLSLLGPDEASLTVDEVISLEDEPRAKTATGRFLHHHRCCSNAPLHYELVRGVVKLELTICGL